MDWSILGGIADVAGSLFQTGYNLYTNKRDFDYQKALQQQIFEREDTAVQRRMADLEAAGINPNLAAGSAANAGSVVSRSSTNDINVGSALDTLQAINSIRMQKQEQKNAEKTGEILELEKSMKEDQELVNYFNSQVSLAEAMYYLGLPVAVETKSDGNTFTPYIKLDDSDIGQFRWNTPKPLLDNLNYTLNYNKNAADLIQKDNNWYTADKISGMALGLLGLGNSASGWRKAFNK